MLVSGQHRHRRCSLKEGRAREVHAVKRHPHANTPHLASGHAFSELVNVAHMAVRLVRLRTLGDGRATLSRQPGAACTRSTLGKGHVNKDLCRKHNSFVAFRWALHVVQVCCTWCRELALDCPVSHAAARMF